MESFRKNTVDGLDQSIDSMCEVTVYGNITDLIAENRVYQLTYMTLSKFK